MSNYDIIKTLNLSKQQKKRFNKALNEGGGSGSVSDNEYDIYLEIEDEQLAQTLLDKNIYINNFYDNLPITQFDINLEYTFKQNDIVNIYLNNIYYSRGIVIDAVDGFLILKDHPNIKSFMYTNEFQHDIFVGEQSLNNIGKYLIGICIYNTLYIDIIHKINLYLKYKNLTDQEKQYNRNAFNIIKSTGMSYMYIYTNNFQINYDGSFKEINSLIPVAVDIVESTNEYYISFINKDLKHKYTLHEDGSITYDDTISYKIDDIINRIKTLESYHE